MCGPFYTTSTTKHMYYVIFVDDFLESVGSTSCRRKIIHSQNFVSSNHQWRKTRGSMWRLLGAEMVVNTSPINSRTSTAKKEFRENWLCLITHSRMGSQKERTKHLWVKQERCCMIRAYHCICGRRHETQWYLWKTAVLIGYLAWVHQKRLLLVRNLMFHILRF